MNVLAQADQYLDSHPGTYITRPMHGCRLWVARDRNAGTIIAAEYTLKTLLAALAFLDSEAT